MGRPFVEQLKEGQAIAIAEPTTLNNSSINTGNGMNMSIMRRARAIFNVGAITGGGALTIALQASATSGGSFANITLSTTAVVVTGITTASAPNALEIRADQMPTGKPWLRAIATETGTQNVLCAITLVADCSEYSPGNQCDTVTWTNNIVGY